MCKFFTFTRFTSLITLLCAFIICASPLNSQAITPPPQDKEDAALIPAKGTNGLWGYVDASSRKVRIEPRYAGVELFRQGFAIVKRGENKTGIINRAGVEVLSPTHNYIDRAFYYVEGGKAVVLPGLFTVNDGKEGLFDASKGWIIPQGTCEGEIWVDKNGFASCDGVDYSPGGHAYKAPKGFKIAQRDALTRTFIIENKNEDKNEEPAMGAMREDGKLFISAKYHDLQIIPAIPLWLGSTIDSKIVSKLKQGKLPDIRDDEDIMTVEVLDASGKVLRSFRANKYPYISGETYDYISKGAEHSINARSGAEVGEKLPKADPGTGFQVYKDGSKYGVKDRSGNVSVKATYGYIYDLGGGLFAVAGRHEYYVNNQGVIDGTGKVIIPSKYCSIEPSSYPTRDSGPLLCWEYSSSTSKGGYWLIDRTGRTISPHAYLNTFYFNSSGQAEAVLQGGGHGVLDYTGKEILPFIYSSIFDELRMANDDQADIKTTPAEALYRVEKNGLWGIYNGEGKELLPIKYGYIAMGKNYSPNGYAVLEDKERQLHGLFELRSGIVIPPLYDSVLILPERFIGELPGGENSHDKRTYVFMDRKGKTVSRVEYTVLEWFPEIKVLAARVDYDHDYALLDPRSGKAVTAAIYNYIQPEPPAGFWTDTGSGRELVDANGKASRMGN